MKKIQQILPETEKLIQQTKQLPNKVLKLHGIDTVEELNKHKFIVDICAKKIVVDYEWTKELGDLATSLIYYFNGIEFNLDLNKSIAICGKYGTGKSILMNIFREYLKIIKNPNPNLFGLTSTEEIIYQSDISTQSYGLLLFNVDNYDGMCKPINILINEFGYRYDGKLFGTNYMELFEMFLMKRYDIFQQYGKLTHATMNVDTDGLQSTFSDRIVDRLKEMFNIIELKGESFRK